MRIFIISMIIGVVAGIIDIIPMIIQKLDRKATVSAFVHYILVAIVIVNITIPGLVWWLKGGVVSLALSIPILIIISGNDKKAVPIIASMAIILGTLISFAAHYCI